jgi:hypothetical protein
MKRFALALVGAALLVQSASAAEIGQSFHFTTPRPQAAGCTDFDDAIRIKELRSRYGWDNSYWQVREFVDWVGVHGKRACMILNETSSDGDNWRIVKKIIPRGPTFGNAWFCLEGTIDYRSATEIAAEREFKQRVRQAAEKAGRSPTEIERLIRDIRPSAWGGSDEPGIGCFWIWMNDKPLARPGR